MAKVWICAIGKKSLSTKSVDSRPVKRLGLPIWTTDGRSSAPKTAFPANGQETTKAPKTRWLCFKRNLMARPESRASEQLQRDWAEMETIISKECFANRPYDAVDQAAFGSPRNLAMFSDRSSTLF